MSIKALSFQVVQLPMDKDKWDEVVELATKTFLNEYNKDKFDVKAIKELFTKDSPTLGMDVAWCKTPNNRIIVVEADENRIKFVYPKELDGECNDVTLEYATKVSKLLAGVEQ